MIKLLWLLLFFPLSLIGQDTAIYFEKRFGTASNDISRSVKQLASGSIFIVGNSNSGNIGNGDIALTKLDKFGNWEWTEYYGTDNTENAFYLNTTSDGNFVFVAESETSFNNNDILLFKVDTSGGVIWNKTYATDVNESPRYVEQTLDGGYVVCGSQNDAFGSNNSLVVKFDANGNYEWDKSFGEAQNDYASMIHQLASGGYVLTADTRSYGAQQIDIAIYNLNAAGNQNWMQLHGDSLVNGCQGLLVTADKHFISYGETEVFPNSYFDCFLEKMDSSGTVNWHNYYGGAGADAAFSVIEANDGGYMLTGYSNSFNGGGPIDLVIMKADTAGNFLWQQTYGDGGVDIGYEIIKSTVTPGYVIVGYTTNMQDNTQDYYVLSVNPLALINNTGEEKKEELTNIVAYPNPAAAEICFQLKNSSLKTSTTLNITDMLGNSVKTVLLAAGQEKFIVSLIGIPPGMYLYTFTTADGRLITHKIAVK